jgi:glycerophosphocholine phosphodiesterase GPCPD1
MKPRIIPKGNELQPEDCVETFGVVNGVEKIDKGWLTNETILQFKFFNNPFNLKERIKNRLLYVKVIVFSSQSLIKGHVNEQIFFS